MINLNHPATFNPAYNWYSLLAQMDHLFHYLKLNSLSVIFRLYHRLEKEASVPNKIPQLYFVCLFFFGLSMCTNTLSTTQNSKQQHWTNIFKIKNEQLYYKIWNCDLQKKIIQECFLLLCLTDLVIVKFYAFDLYMICTLQLKWIWLFSTNLHESHPVRQ